MTQRALETSFAVASFSPLVDMGVRIANGLAVLLLHRTKGPRAG